MEAHTRSPRELFEGKEHYEIPAFQRPYVWTEEDQWAPLWEDVTRVAEAYIATKEADPAAEAEAHHFLGAVVYESKKPVAGDVTRHDVIDGQQRMTTLQVLLDAVHEVILARGHLDMAESLEELIVNGSPRFARKRERFKLWPSQADRAAFEHAMDPLGTWAGGEHRVIDAHAFFRQEAQRWISGSPDDDGALPPGSELLRVEALSSTLADRLVLVAIDLSGHDDAQLIFETLNDRGTPLLKADLIKNWLFRKGERLGAEVHKWADTQWAEFDTRWWREEIKQGRLTRSRVDIFLQYWLTMRRQDEVKVDNTFRIFAEYAEPLMTSAEAADRLLADLRRDADTYHDFAQLEAGTAEGRFYTRVIERLELAVTTPVFLWMLSKNHGVPNDQVRVGLEALESWAIRRTLLRLTTKDLNKFVVAILKLLDSVEPDYAGDSLVAYLSTQTSETRIWPSDARLHDQLPGLRMYGNLRQDRLRVVLGAIEQHLRNQSKLYEAVQLPSGLEIEHVMPQGWRTHWNPEPVLNPESAAERDRLVNTLGNLTLVTRSLNGSLSNRPWTDAEAAGLKEGGEPGTGKWALLNEFSLLVLNKEILKDHPESWTDAAIRMRSTSLTSAICRIWPGPIAEVQTAASEAAAADPSDALVDIYWSQDDVARLAAEAGETLRIVLDTLAVEPGREWLYTDFTKAGLTKWAHAALGALTNKVHGSFGRSNVPVIFHQIGSTWAWSVDEDFATKWRRVRNPGR